LKILKKIYFYILCLGEMKETAFKVGLKVWNVQSRLSCGGIIEKRVTSKTVAGDDLLRKLRENNSHLVIANRPK